MTDKIKQKYEENIETENKIGPTDNQNIKNDQTNEKQIDLSNEVHKKYKCKSCLAEFDTLQLCLSHELIHINLVEKKSKRKQTNNRKKRKKQKSLPSVQLQTNMKLSSNNDCPETKYLQNTVTAILSQCPEGQELNYLCRIFQPMPEDLSLIYQSIYVDLNADLLKVNCQWQITPFGSTIMGMALKESDIDFYVYPYDEDDQNSDNVYKEVIKVLRRSKRFSQIITIPKARVPIIKCTHKVTGYNLDINVSSVLGVHSSQFIAKLFSLDSRIHPLMLILKIWAKYCNITGTGRITNYCLTLLVIAYLQNINPPILPPIKELQTDTQEILVKGINYAFNANYVKKNEQDYRNIKDILHGFFEFYLKFDFSSYIISSYLGKMINRNDFQTKKFSFPEYDRLLDFLKINYPLTNIKRELHCESIKLDSLIVIQDPFCLNHNNSASIGKNIFDLFKIHLANANRICSEFSLSKNQRPSELLLRLFFEKPTTSVLIPMLQPISTSTTSSSTNAGLEKRNTTTSTNTGTIATATTTLPTSTTTNTTITNKFLSSISSSFTSSVSSDNFMIFRISPIESELFYVRTYLRKTFPNKLFDKIDINKFWIEKIIEFTRNILKNIFKIEIIDCNNDENSLNAKISRTNLQQTHVCHNNDNDNDTSAKSNDNLKRYTMTCELKAIIDTWSSRKNDFKKSFTTYLNEQLEITKNFENIRREDNFPGNLHCKLYMKPEENFCVLSLMLEDLIPNKYTASHVIQQNKNNKSNLKMFFTQYTSRMRYLYRAYFEKLATFKK